MAHNLTFDKSAVFEFVTQHIPLTYSAQTGIGLVKDGEIVCGVVYDDYTISNLFMHVAAVPGRKWLTKDAYKDFAHACFYYPFGQLGCKRVTGWVEASNTEARRFDEHLGFKQEAVLKSAARDGGDVIIYAMFADECRYI